MAKGHLNGVGGHIEINESALQAMEREFFEEVGLCQNDMIAPWKLVARGVCRMCSDLYVFGCQADIECFTKFTDEEPVIVIVDHLPSDCISNLIWLIPLAKDMLINGLPPKPVHFSYI